MSGVPASETLAPGQTHLLRSVAARAHWRSVDFISDLHLHAGDLQTVQAWQDYLCNTTAQALFILGDLFDVWVGDDVLTSDGDKATSDQGFESRCAHALQRAGAHLDLFFLCGNRDFLLGNTCLQACAMQGLDDPCLLQLGGQRWLLSHGDALCLDDLDYQQFRGLVRSPSWQAQFLAQPLAERQETARRLRAQSEQHKRANPAPSVVDARATQQWLSDANATTLIHGHTHQPADHDLAQGLRRIVLSDWDLGATPQRAQVLRLSLDESGNPVDLRRMSAAQAC